MGGISIRQIIFMLGLNFVLFGIPALFILRKAGFSPWFSLVTAVPLLNLVALWVLAFVRWPGGVDRVKSEVFE